MAAVVQVTWSDSLQDHYWEVASRIMAVRQDIKVATRLTHRLLLVA